jgi:hypothetical protein
MLIKVNNFIKNQEPSSKKQRNNKIKALNQIGKSSLIRSFLFCGFKYFNLDILWNLVLSVAEGWFLELVPGSFVVLLRKFVANGGSRSGY